MPYEAEIEEPGSGIANVGIVTNNEACSLTESGAIITDTIQNENWGTYKPVDLKRQRTNVLVPTQDLNQKRKTNPSRRRPATAVKALSSNKLSEKYDALVDKRLIIADYKEKKVRNEIQFNSTEHDLRVQALKLEIEIKKETLNSLRETNK